jgi:hypothetical protein
MDTTVHGLLDPLNSPMNTQYTKSAQRNQIIKENPSNPIIQKKSNQFQLARHNKSVLVALWFHKPIITSFLFTNY